MADYNDSPLTDPDFLQRASAGNVLADALNNPDFLEAATVADRNENDIAAQGTYINDLKTMSYGALNAKYGREVADNRGNLQREAERQYAVRDTDRSHLQEAGDAVLGAGSAFVGLVGGVESAILGAGGAVDEYFDEENTGLSEFSTGVAETTARATEFITSFQSDELKARKRLAAISAELDNDDSNAQFERQVEAGGIRGTSFVANIQQLGRDALNAGDRLLDDGAVAGDIVAAAIGSLGPSAKLAAGGVKLAEAAAGKVTTNATANRLAAVVGSAGGIGIAEASGTYSETANFVLSKSEEEMGLSEHYVELRNGGMEHDQAQRIVAASTAQEAAIRQLPTAAALGLLAAKFNASPIRAFKGKGLVGGLREVGAQALEEGLQGATAGYNQNVAVQHQVDPNQRAVDGVGEQFTVGAFAGAGMAGVLGAPVVAGSGAAALLSQAMEENSVTRGALRTAVNVGGPIVGDAVDTVYRGTKAAAEFAKPVTDPIIDRTVATVAPVVAKAQETIQDIADRPDARIQTKAIEAGVEAVRIAGSTPAAVDIQDATDVISNLALPETKIRKMSEADVLAASEVIQKLKSSANNLPIDVKTQVKKMLSSPDLVKLAKRMVKIDHNISQNAETEVNSETTQDTIRMAKTNPANVNPDHVDKILKHASRSDISENDLQLMKVASNIARAVNNHTGQQIEISKNKSVALSKKPAYNGREAPEILDAGSVSRSIQVGGFKGERSVNDFAADILEATQTSDGTFQNDEGHTVPVAEIVTRFNKFAQHMVNKVGAFNASIANGQNGTGTTEKFVSLTLGGELVQPGAPGNAAGVYYHSNSPKSVEIAEKAHNDATVAVEVYNIMAEQFPELFPGGKLSVPDLATSESQTDLSVADDVQVDTNDVVDTEVENTVEQESETPSPDTTAVEEAPEAPAPDVTEQSETENPAPTAQDLALNETRTQEEFDAMTDDQILESVNNWEEDVQNLPMAHERVQQVMAALNPIIERFNLPSNLIRRITWLQSPEKSHAGQAYWAERVMGLKPSVVKKVIAGTQEGGLHVAYHEMMHLIDAMASNTFGQTASMSESEFDAGDGEIYAEVRAFADSDPEIAEYFSYALSFSTIEEVSSELFAEIGAMMLLSPEAASNLPKGVAYVEKIIAQAGGKVPAVETVEQRDDTSSEPEVAPELVEEDGPKQPVTKKFEETFTPRVEEVDYTSGQDILDKVPASNENYLRFAEAVVGPLIAGANARLKSVLFSKKDGRTIAEVLQAGEDITHIRDFKLTMLVDPATGEYDPDLLSIAAVAVVDWMSSVRSADPSQLNDTLEDLGVSLGSLEDGDLNNIMYGVSPRQATEGLANQIIRMWNVKKNPDAQLVDARGAVEGLVKELITVLDAEFDFIEINNIPVVKDGKKGTTPTINVKGLGPIQKEIGLTGQNAVQKTLAPEQISNPSIGEPIVGTDNTQTRGDVKLSQLERAALKNLQDTPHLLAAGVTNLVTKMGFDVISKMLGFKDVTDLAKGHPLRNSIEGKNLSIQRDWDDAQAVVDGIDSEKSTPVYYPVGISTVGRHQFKGINPQNNKILRALVTPTHADLDMTQQEDQDAFWLTVAQSSGISKVENEVHSEILANIQDLFAAEFGEAVAIVEEFLETGTLDEVALLEATGEIEMAQLNTIFAVADLNRTEDKTQFKTTLSFELDGKTDGPANMMSNFGQGTLTQEDMSNFERVGFFLGSKVKTLNEFFGRDGNVDLYEVTSSRAQARMFSDIAKAGSGQKAAMYAAQRFAAFFGDFQINEDGSIEMTRNTSKNPMTKTVYGSGVRGVASGIADEMMLGFYEKMVDVPSDQDPESFLGYPDLKKDFELLFGTNYPTDVSWKDSFLDKASLAVFEDLVTETIGQTLSDTAKSVIGAPITHVNDTLVFVTGVQTAFLQALFQQKLHELAEKRAKEGTIDRNSKGEPVLRQMTQRDYDGLVKELREYAPLYANGAQTLAVGSFSGQTSDIELSSNLSGNLRMKSTLQAPDLAGVKIIPYISIGRGDAMMMNTIYGSDTAPKDTLAVFDGIDMPVNKVKEYAQTINQAVLGNWDRNVLGDIEADFEKFLASVSKEDAHLLEAAFAATKEGAKKTTVVAANSQQLLDTLKEARRQNQARKKVFKDIPLAVDHMGGSDTAYTRGPDGEMDLAEINARISAELAGEAIPVQTETESEAIADTDATPEGDTVAETVILETDTNSLVVALERETRNKVVRDTVKVIKDLVSDNTKVIIDPSVENGSIDIETRVMTLKDVENHETIAHELVHLATFEAVLAHYEGVVNDAVTRLETLMAEFMDMTFTGKTETAANAAKAQILGYQNNTDPFSQAAALNEFMAWTLTNDLLIKSLKSRDTVMLKFGRTVKALMQRLLGSVPKDIYSNILFNASIINTPPVQNTGGNGNNGNNNQNGGLTPPAHNFTNFWIDLVRERLDALKTAAPGRTAKVDQFKRYNDAAADAVSKLDFGGFNLSNYQKQTFRAIHMVIAMELRLNTSSAIAVNKLFTYVTDNLTPEMFGTGRNGQERYSAVRELMGATKNDEGISDAIAVMIALSQTSDGFRRALDQLPTPETTDGVVAGSLNEFLTSVTGILMNKAVGSIDTSAGSVKESLDSLSNDILREDGDKEFSFLQGLMGSINAADAYTSGAMSKLAERANDFDIKMKASDRTQLTKVITGTVAGAAAFLDADRAAVASEGIKKVTHMGVLLDWAVPVREFVTELVGTDKTNAEVTALLDRTNTHIAAARQDFRESLPVIFQNVFDNVPDAAQWKAAHQILGKIDFSHLFNLANPSRAFRLITNSGALTQEIGAKETTINAKFSPAVATVILEKSRQLAAFMNNEGAGHQLWKNAYAINRLAGEFDAAMTSEIDSLVSLYALQGADQAQKDVVAEMYANDPEAVLNLVTYLKALNKEEDLKAGITDAARMNGYKGFLPDLAKGNTTLKIARDSEQESLEKRGYTRVGDFTAEDGYSSVSRGYYTTTVKQNGAYSQGVMQSVHGTYRGVDIETGKTVTGDTSGTVSQRDAVDRITTNLNNGQGVANDKEVMIPVYEGNSGLVAHYERAINPDHIAQFKTPTSNLALMLGVWAGRQVEELQAQAYNNELIGKLKEIYDDRAPGEDGLFVNLADKNLKDKIFKDTWNVIPDATKSTIESVYGEGEGFWVRKDMVNLALGYRDPSIVDVWSGKTRIPEGVQTAVQAATKLLMGNRALTILSKTEEGVQSAVAYAKNIIVTKSLIVPYMNTQANVMQLTTRGVGTKQMIRGYREKTAELEQYNENVKKRIELQTRILLAAGNANRVAILEQQLQVIADQNARMSIAPLIEAGAYKNISEGITDLDVELTSGRMGEWVEAKVNSLPAGLQTAAKYGMLSKDTAVYKFANKAVQYGDFLAKSILFDHLTAQGLSETEALVKINEEFVNFSVLPGRTRSYLEGLGGTWFLTFKIRIMKIAMQMLRDNPVRALIVANTVGEFGSPVNDNLATVIAQDRLDYSLGWEMLFGAPHLNPWAQLMDW